MPENLRGKGRKGSLCPRGGTRRSPTLPAPGRLSDLCMAACRQATAYWRVRLFFAEGHCRRMCPSPQQLSQMTSSAGTSWAS